MYREEENKPLLHDVSHFIEGTDNRENEDSEIKAMTN